MTRVSLYRHATWIDNPTHCYTFMKQRQERKNRRLGVEYVCRSANKILGITKEDLREALGFINNEEGD